MLLYLTSNENNGIADFLQKPPHNVVVRKLVASFNLKEFFTKDIKGFSHISQILIDLSAVQGGDAELLEAVRAFQILYDHRLIFFIEGCRRGNETVSKLISAGVTNIVSATTVAGIEEELLLCMSMEGMGYSHIKDFDLSDTAVPVQRGSFRVLQDRNVQIAIGGAGGRVGTTSHAVAMAVFLAQCGTTVCYHATQPDGFLPILAAAYEDMQKKADFYTKDGVDYYDCTTPPDEQYQFTIIDCGNLAQLSDWRLFNNADVRIVTTGCKPHEIAHIAMLLDKLAGKKVELLVYAPVESRLEQLKTLLKPIGTPYYSAYMPDFFVPEANAATYEQLLIRHIVEVCEVEKPPEKRRNIKLPSFLF